MIELFTEELRLAIPTLHTRDKVLLSGTVYTARDAAHKRIKQLMDSGSPLPFELKGSSIYYAGPTAAKEGMAVGSCGPTTSSRMDIYTPSLIDLGLVSMIGKGKRSKEVVEAIVRNKAIYFCAIGGLGALAACRIKSCKVFAFEDLGCESIKLLEFNKFPLIVGIDCCGNDIFDKI